MTLADRLRRVADALPDGASLTLPVAQLRAWLAEEQAQPTPSTPIVSQHAAETWRERLWTVPEPTRIGVHELAEALDRSPDWIYRAVSTKWAEKRGRQPLPCSRLDGCLSFTAGAVRRWLETNERVVRAESKRGRLALHKAGA